MDINEYQERVDKWMLQVFGKEVLEDKKERSHRFAEEAMELLQATGYTREELQQMIDYVYNRPVGVVSQEVGGVVHCLSALCSADQLSLQSCMLKVLFACEDNSIAIREKHSKKPDSIASNKNYSNGEEKNTLP